MKRRAALTLVEPLLFIAIIAVVAAILFPVLASSKRSAKRTTALSNVEQIGKAVQLYLNDYDDTLPFRFPSLPSWPGFGEMLIIDSDSSKGFSALLGPYLRSTAVWYSPEDRLAAPGYTSFCVNGQLAYSWSMSSFARPAAPDQFHMPPGKTEMKFKKGDRLPDGTMADHAVKISSDGR